MSNGVLGAALDALLPSVANSSSKVDAKVAGVLRRRHRDSSELERPDAILGQPELRARDDGLGSNTEALHLELTSRGD
eukprot:7961545-Pyramimonas_sp.AAC.1